MRDDLYFLRFRLMPLSLVSMRIPFTFQAAASYPLPPPSVITGMLANAVWQATGASPLEMLEKLKKRVHHIWAKSLGRISITSAVVKTLFFDQNKLKSNILSREYLFAPRGYEIIVATDEMISGMVREALPGANLHLGDSEGIASVGGIDLLAAELTGPPPDTTCFYFPAEWAREIGHNGEKGSRYWVDEFPAPPKKHAMRSYTFTVSRRQNFYIPSELAVSWAENVKGITLEDGTSLPWREAPR